MANLTIVKYPDPVLRKKAEEIKNISDPIVELAKMMVVAMRNAGGIGLAANQVGRPIRLIVVDHDKEREPWIIVNPELVLFDEEDVKEEGCLSIPGYFEFVKRFRRVLVKGLDLKEREILIEAEGILARALQHEIDHINGILFIDHLSPVKRSIFRKKYELK